MIFTQIIPAKAIVGHYEQIYVVLSFIIATIASYVALDFAQQLRREESPLLQRYWHLGGAVLIGAGVWCMHFTGMLAYNMGMEHKYNVGITLLSLLLPIAFAFVIFQIIKSPVLKISTIVLAAPVLALSILSMHYTGMAAMQMRVDLFYTPGWFAVSVLIAVVASAVALWFIFIYAHARQSSRVPFHMLGSLIMGAAICGMHYSGMHAAVFVPQPDCVFDPAFPDRPKILAIAIGVITILIFAVAIGALRINEIMARHLKEQVRLRTGELEAANEDLLHAKEKAEEANIAKSEFLANMSHEIRTPMNAVIGITHILRNDMVPPEKKQEFLETLQTSAESLLTLLSEILDISKIEANKIQLESIPFNLKELAEEIISLLSIRANEKRIYISLFYDLGIGTEFLGDPLRVRQILVNLLSNAVKFTHNGGVEIQIKNDPESGQVEIAVQDTGTGIGSEKIKGIFDKFTQEDASTTRKFGGTGLGLAITKALVDKMEGAINVTSAIGKGSLFVVHLPLESLNVQSVVDLEEKNFYYTGPGQELDQNQTAKQSVLLVEDSTPNIMVATNYLEHLGYEFEVAKNGREALAAFRRKKYDLILMDIHMPELDGFDVARAVREQEYKSGALATPIIALTAFASQHDREKCLRHGMDEYIAKPFRIEELQEKITGLLNRSEAVPLPDRIN
jgi:signal transduction histidine kinase/CheY-like chemotaxis protein